MFFFHLFSIHTFIERKTKIKRQTENLHFTTDPVGQFGARIAGNRLAAGTKEVEASRRRAATNPSIAHSTQS